MSWHGKQYTVARRKSLYRSQTSTHIVMQEFVIPYVEIRKKFFLRRHIKYDIAGVNHVAEPWTKYSEARSIPTHSRNKNLNPQEDPLFQFPIP
jgi:hypothetical protein